MPVHLRQKKKKKKKRMIICELNRIGYTESISISYHQIFPRQHNLSEYTI